MEQGKRVSEQEKRTIEKFKDTVFVSYQSCGYKDERTEIRILKNAFRMETVKRSNEMNVAEFVLVQDQLKAHKCSSALE
jgi:hypothetical protein